MKKPAPSTWIIIGLGIVIAVLLLMWPTPEEPDTQIWKDSLSKKETQIKVLQAQAGALLDSIRKDSVEGVKESEAYKVKISRLTKRLSELRPQVDSIIVDNPVLIEYVNQSDSVIETQGWRIDALNHQVAKLQVNMVGITQNFENQIALERGRYEDQKRITEVYQKDLKKEKRRAKLAKVLIPVAFVGGLLLGIQ